MLWGAIRYSLTPICSARSLPTTCCCPQPHRRMSETASRARGARGPDIGDPIMIFDRMSRSVRVLLLLSASIAAAALAVGCGTQHISVPPSSPLHTGAVLFSQRCSGCHTLSYAAANGSAPNVRTAQAISGPNFNVRCERPVTRVLYAIANGGFSGAYMPQNIVVGQDAIDVAKFVATYAGRSAPREIGIVQCDQKQLGVLPSGSGTPSAGQPTATAAQIATSTTGGNTGTATETSATQTSTAP